MDLSLLRELFPQQLLSNISMTLASTAKRSNLQESAKMANSVMEVISPYVTIVATPQATEYGKFKSEVASLRRQLSDLQATGRRRSNNRSNKRTQSHSHSPQQSGVCWSHRCFAILPENAHLYAASRETIGPATRGDEHCWPYTNSPVLITDHISGLKFLNDIGSEASVVLRLHAHWKTECNGPSLQATNNITIPSQDYNSYIWFLLAIVKFETLTHIQMGFYNHRCFQDNIRC